MTRSHSILSLSSRINDGSLWLFVLKCCSRYLYNINYYLSVSSLFYVYLSYFITQWIRLRSIKEVQSMRTANKTSLWAKTTRMTYSGFSPLYFMFVCTTHVLRLWRQTSCINSNVFSRASITSKPPTGSERATHTPASLEQLGINVLIYVRNISVVSVFTTSMSSPLWRVTKS